MRRATRPVGTSRNPRPLAVPCTDWGALPQSPQGPTVTHTHTRTPVSQDTFPGSWGKGTGLSGCTWCHLSLKVPLPRPHRLPPAPRTHPVTSAVSHTGHLLAPRVLPPMLFLPVLELARLRTPSLRGSARVGVAVASGRLGLGGGDAGFLWDPAPGSGSRFRRRRRFPRGRGGAEERGGCSAEAARSPSCVGSAWLRTRGPPPPASLRPEERCPLGAGRRGRVLCPPLGAGSGGAAVRLGPV